MTSENPPVAETAKKPQDPIAACILDLVAAGRSVSFQEVAQAFHAARRSPTSAPDGWRAYMTAVRQQAIHLARHGEVEITREGKPVDPENFRGVVRLRRAGDHQPDGSPA